MSTNVLKALGALGVLATFALGAATPTGARVLTGPGWHHHQLHRPSPWGIPNNFYSRYPYWGAAGIERRQHRVR